MHARTLAAALVALAATVVLAVPALAGPATGQVNVRETNSTCKLTFATVGSQKRLILFHIINNGTVPHGIIVWGVKSTMALPKGEANLFVKFRKGGKYNYACTAGSYKHPSIIRRGVFVIKKS
jgi:hypothetical protein